MFWNSHPTPTTSHFIPSSLSLSLLRCPLRDVMGRFAVTKRMLTLKASYDRSLHQRRMNDRSSACKACTVATGGGAVATAQISEWQLGGVSAVVCGILPPLHTTLVWQSARMCPSVCWVRASVVRCSTTDAASEFTKRLLKSVCVCMSVHVCVSGTESLHIAYTHTDRHRHTHTHIHFHFHPLQYSLTLFASIDFVVPIPTFLAAHKSEESLLLVIRNRKQDDRRILDGRRVPFSFIPFRSASFRFAFVYTTVKQ